MQNTPRVTPGEILCKRELLEGNPVINHVLHKTTPCIYIPNHSTIMGGIYAKVTLGMYPLIESERS